MTYQNGHICSHTPELRVDPNVTENWWGQLQRACNTLADYPTDRIRTTQEKVSHRILVFFGDEVNSKITNWTTSHGDLYWRNLLKRDFTILD